MDMTLAGFVALGTLVVGLFAWLRQDIRELRAHMGELRANLDELRERAARIEGLLEAVFMRRDHTSFPEIPPAGTPPDRSTAA